LKDLLEEMIATSGFGQNVSNFHLTATWTRTSALLKFRDKSDLLQDPLDWQKPERPLNCFHGESTLSG
jgi:hypothetical protein